MPSYTAVEITGIANQICDTYNGTNSLANWYADYRWQGAAVEATWQIRTNLQDNLLESEFALEELQSIHRWGFNEASCTALNDPELLASLQACLRSFQIGLRPQQEASLSAFLRLQRTAKAQIGLARVSKWICFVNQARFAILDSRVSRGLYPIRVATNHRAFPVLAGRGSGASNQMVHWEPDRMARMYLDYIDVIQEVARLQEGMQPAQVEMALFMIGQPALSSPLNPSLRRAMWG